MNFICVKVAVVSEEAVKTNELLGRDTYEDDDINIITRRVMVDKIESYEPCIGYPGQTEITMVSGTTIIAQESAEDIDNRLSSLMIGNVLNDL